MGLFGGLLGGIFGGGSSSTSTSTVESNVTVDVTNQIDLAQAGALVGAALEDTANTQAASTEKIVAAQLNQQADIAIAQGLQFDKASKIAVVFGIGIITFLFMRKK